MENAMKSRQAWPLKTIFGVALGWGIATHAALAAAPMSQLSSFDAVVEAERQTVMAAQVSGAVVEISVKAGDRVQAGQTLLRMDAQAANQSAAVSEAQVQSARAALAVASKDYERQKQLFAQDYISQAALERAEARFKATEAETNAQLAQAGAARTQAGYYTLRAPYAGVIAEVPVTLGDMAMPGRPLLVLYDPAGLRVTAAVPQGSVQSGWTAGTVKVELPGQPAEHQWVAPSYLKVLPTVDPATHTMQVRLGLPAGTTGVAPGMFARAWLPGAEKTDAPIQVPLAAVVRRAEMTGLYVLDAQGRPLLRQVRLGRVINDQVEVLSGLNANERVAPDAQAALTAAH
jgi:RND family efflux transporter MFP subunit